MPRHTEKIILKIEKKIKPFIQNQKEFTKLLNENCIVYGKFILQYINNDDMKISTIDIACNYFNFLVLHKLLLLNHFKTISNIDSIDRNTTKAIAYEKLVNGNKLLTMQIGISPNVCMFLRTNPILKIEQSYFNGLNLVIPFKKEVFTKYETNPKIKITNPIIYKKLQYYIRFGYMFTIINESEHIDYKKINQSTTKYLTDLLSYKLF